MPVTRKALFPSHHIPSDGEPQLSSQRQPAIWKVVMPLSPASASPLQPSLHMTALVVIQEAGTEATSKAKPHQQPITRVGVPVPLIPSSLAQESLLDDCKHTYLRKKPKEPDKAPGVRPREPLLSKLKESQSLALLSMGSTPRILPSLSVSSWMDRAKQTGAVDAMKETDQIRTGHDLPCAKTAFPPLKVAPTLPLSVPAVQSSTKNVP